MKVLVTAGASGIGRAMAEAFAAEGAEVWVTDVDKKALSNLPAHWGAADVDASDEAAMADFFAELEARWGRLDVLCANAGIAGPKAPVEEIALADWQRCVSVNLEGAFLAAK
jgi:NAD(P)-dependent dehydrogenase (short-subunit alcohol dehydrogenase family)